ncbi:ATP-binding protein [uncultured Selenomonas sp.]|uniref:ATP-binding protein n=1 Tax=uncultured Selenomonas sp. TaxID=159275 RepID=UPI0025D5DBE1|nr:ATP-binding protein [uncultured Selenomonas sp.]
MKRKITQALASWKARKHHKPLLIHGARQVGKTYAALSFGKSAYQNVVYLNFEGNPELAQIFERNLDPARLLAELSAFFGATILPHETLLIFDEVQACERALTSLKYFAEQAPDFDIIAAGSLLGVALRRETYSFPVGKVDTLTLHPLDFEEFLWALGEDALASAIRTSFEDRTPCPIHEKALDLYHLYLAVGGLPQAAKTYCDTQDFDFVQSEQKNLVNAYLADMAKYATPQETTRILAVWQSLPAQLAKENKKFQYKTVKTGARAYQYATALTWLKASGLIEVCRCVTEGTLPLAAFTKPDAFKIYLADTGLLCARYGIPAHILLHAPHSFDAFKGALTENYVMQALVTNGLMPYYWTDKNQAEVDFVLQTKTGDILPIEVKSAAHVRAKSLQAFRKRYAPPYAIRISSRNFGYEDGLFSLPLYAVFCLRE